MSRSRLLIIAPFCAKNPVRGYEKFLEHHIVELVRYYDIDLVTLGKSGRRQLHHPSGLKSQIEFKSSFFSRMIGGLLCLLKGLPIQCSEFYAPPFRQIIGKLVNSEDYDNVVCYMARTFVSLPTNIHQKTIVFAIDPLVISYRLSARVSGFMRRIAYKIEGFLIGRFECHVIKNAKKFALISQHDVRRCSRLFRPKNRIELIRYGVNISEYNLPLEARDSRKLVVSGSGFYPPNIRALKYLLNFVWPEVSKLGYFHLRIIGADIDPNIRQLAREFPDVEVVGFVDNVFEYLSNSFACFCLVDLDVGIQTKLLEAMSCGTPAICSKASSKGVGALDGREVLVAQLPSEIVAALETLRSHPDRWQYISRNSYDFVERRYQWENSSHDLIKIIESSAMTDNFS